MSRKPYIAGNWKMNLDRASGSALVVQLMKHLGASPKADCAVFVPAVYVAEVAAAAASSPLRVGVQNVHDRASGAFTGETSVSMAKDIGAQSCLVGHSERRHEFGEDLAFIARKVRAVLDSGLELVLCLGETLAEREAGRTEEVVRGQLVSALEGVSRDEMSRTTLAYEPVWAIGTGKVATPAQAGEAHAYLRGVVQGLYDENVSGALRIQYGGSVKAENAEELLGLADVDGALVGGASLKAESFLPILDAAE